MTMLSKGHEFQSNDHRALRSDLVGPVAARLEGLMPQ